MKNGTNSSDSSQCVVYLSTGTIIAIDIIYVIILVVGLCGNVMTCAATVMQKSLRRPIHIYVFNLAVCNLLILTVYVPNDMMRMANQALFVWGPIMCAAMSTVVPVAFNNTIFTLLAISVDRARGIFRPFQWRTDSQRRSYVVLPMIWILSVLLALPVIVHSKLQKWNCGVVCMDYWEDTDLQTKYWYAMFGITFSVPLVLILALHALMFYKINYVLLRQSDNSRHDDRCTLKMIIVIVVVFTLCAGGQHFYFLIVTHTSIEKNHPKLDAILFFGSNMLVTLQSAFNPIIYGKFRGDFNAAYRRMVQVVGMMVCSKVKLSNTISNRYAVAMTIEPSPPGERKFKVNIRSLAETRL